MDGCANSGFLDPIVLPVAGYGRNALDIREHSLFFTLQRYNIFLNRANKNRFLGRFFNSAGNAESKTRSRKKIVALAVVGAIVAERGAIKV